jgi:hypothetical protein
MASAAAVLALLGALTITLHEAHKQLREARSWYQKSLRTWQQDPNHSSLQPSSGNGAEQSTKQLAKCEAALAKLSPESSKSVAHNSVETKP